MTSRLVQYTRVQQATSFALSTCSAPIYQARMSIETATMQAFFTGRGQLGLVSPLVSIYHMYQDLCYY